MIWLPPRTEGERAFGTEARLLAMLPDGNNPRPRYARLSLDGLQSLNQVTLIFDPRDVTLLEAEVPPLSGSRLALALPNIVEDALLQDPAGCAIVAGPRVPGQDRRAIAVIDHGWLEFTVGAFERRGIRVKAAWPAQLALPIVDGQWSVAAVQQSLALRTAPAAGLGWVGADSAQRRAETVAAMLQAALLKYPRPKAIDAYIDDAEWHEPMLQAARQLQFEMRVFSLPVPGGSAIDLLAGRRDAARRWFAAVDWRSWRRPAALGAATVAVALLGLNLHWAVLAQEKRVLRDSLEQRFRATFPNAQVVVDPLLQMQRQVATLRAQAGQSGPDDFVPLLTRFSQALGPRALDALAGVEYRDGGLRVQFRPQQVETPAARDALREACARQGLRLQFDNERDPRATVRLQS
ncbi:MAG TPA: type II secretion system protein GspL [Burkholderiaceae bacterium]|nr:type II secretion system protein GspL [Burkholderiaceae bacterium]